MTKYVTDAARSDRFEFSANWAKFFNALNDERIAFIFSRAAHS